MSYYIAQDRFGNYDLTHHGIKGQKWGVRRYQNEDGSLTADGKVRYEKGVRGLNRLDRDIAKAKYQRAKNRVKLNKAQAKGNLKAIEKRKALEKELSKSISDGEKETKRLLNKLSSEGYSIGSKQVNRYAKLGNSVAVYLLFGATGLIPLTYAGAQFYKGRHYGAETAGLVKGQKYYNYENYENYERKK